MLLGSLSAHVPTSAADVLQLFLALAVGGLILSIVVLVVAPARGEDTCTVDDLDALDDAGPAWPAEPGPKMPCETSTSGGAANIIAVLGAVATAAFLVVRALLTAWVGLAEAWVPKWLFVVLCFFPVAFITCLLYTSPSPRD